MAGYSVLSRAASVALGLALAAAAGGAEGCASGEGARRDAGAVRGRIAPANSPSGVPAAARAAGDSPAPKTAELDARGLEKRWDFALEEPIAGLWLHDDSIYVYTGKRHLYSIALDTGLVRWQYALPDGLSQPPTVYRYTSETIRGTDEVLIVSKDTLHVVDRQHGFLLWKKQLDFPVSSPASGSHSHVYVGSWNGRIYAIAKDDHRVDWSYVTSAPITARAEVAEGAVEAVFVGGEDGRIYAFSPVREERKWWHRTGGPITAPPFFFKTYLFVGSSDFNLYAVRTIDGGIEWRYPAGAPIKQSPVAFSESDDVVYAIAGDAGLVALHRRPDPKTGYVRWSFPGGTKVLAKGRRDLYVLDEARRVVALALETGKPRWASPLATGAEFHAFDPWDPLSLLEREKRLASTIVLGYPDGWLVALREKAEF